MITLLKIVCLAIYALALASFTLDLSATVTDVARYGTLLLLAGHLLEVLVAFRSIRLYKGPLAASIALTMLFGFLHWLPLARESARAARAAR